MNGSEKSVIDTLRYFHFFKFPLEFEELYLYLQHKENKDNLRKLLNELLVGRQIFEINGCYSLENDASLVQRKRDGKILADHKIRTAKKNAGIINTFPFVRAVFISGSLSKGFADESSDIDFFIITEKNRLWISRTLLHIFKKLMFILNRQHNFCMNYFIDSSEMELEEKNIFTAYEIATLIPCRGFYLYNDFLDSNRWILDYLPNYKKKIYLAGQRTGRLKYLIEKVINLFAPNMFNERLMKLTDNLWRKKWKKRGYDMSQYDLAFKTRINISKNHAKNYQKIVLKFNGQK